MLPLGNSDHRIIHQSHHVEDPLCSSMLLQFLFSFINAYVSSVLHFHSSASSLRFSWKHSCSRGGFCHSASFLTCRFSASSAPCQHHSCVCSSSAWKESINCLVSILKINYNSHYSSLKYPLFPLF